VVGGSRGKPATPRRIRLSFSALCLAFFFVAAVPLYRELSQRGDIWWTPYTMLVPLAESGDRVEIYARGKPFAALLRTGQLRTAGDGAPGVLAVSDIGLRFNNRDRVRAERLPMLLASAAGCGATACLFLLMLSGRLAYRGEKER
jgi:hypothetical protein